MAKAAADRLGWTGGWWRGARRCPSPNHGPRPAGSGTGLALLHSISLPPGVYGGDEVEQLFLNRLDPDTHPYFDRLRGLRVSSHFFIRRDGQVLQFVPCDRRAWHAGVSHWRGRDGCNDFSIGIELEGLEGERFEPVQYAVLARLLRALLRRWGVREAVGHEHVAPGRKFDPGPGFDWGRLATALRGAALALFGQAPAQTRPGRPKPPAGRMAAGRDRPGREPARAARKRSGCPSGKS